MSPRRNKLAEDDLISQSELIDKLDKLTPKLDRKVVARYIRKLLSAFFDCSPADKRKAKYKMIPGSSDSMIGFNIIIPGSKNPKAGTIFLTADEFKGMDHKKNGEEISLVSRFRLKLDLIQVPDKSDFPVRKGKIDAIENNPDFTLDVTV